MDSIVAEGADFEELLTGFEFLEGPSWHPGGQYLVFSDIIGNCMYRWSPEDGKSIWRKPSSMANGTTWDREGNLLICEHASSRVCRMAPDGGIEVLASHYEGHELNSPNDIVVKSNGDIYFTDPNSGRTSPWGVPREQELPFQGVYRLETGSGRLYLVGGRFFQAERAVFFP